MSAPTLPSLLQCFFTDRLLAQLGASPRTVASYRDTFRMLLQYAAERLKRAPSQLRLEDLDVAFLSQFLDHLERDRGTHSKHPSFGGARLLPVRRAKRARPSSDVPTCAGDADKAL